MRSRFGCFAVCCFLLALLSCVCLLLAPREAGAEPTEVIVTNWPTPMPTQVPIPTACTAAPVWAGPSASPICGVAAVTVSHANGERGYDLAQLAAIVFGFGFVGICILAKGLVSK